MGNSDAEQWKELCKLLSLMINKLDEVSAKLDEVIEAIESLDTRDDEGWGISFEPDFSIEGDEITKSA